MSDFTVDDTMAEIRYELDDREIFNDIRSEIGTIETETVVDADPLYKWKIWDIKEYLWPGQIKTTGITNYPNPLAFKLENIRAWNQDDITGDVMPYYDYSVYLTLGVPLKDTLVTEYNFGTISPCYVEYNIGYKYLAAEGITHEETVPITLTVRATDATSITKYGRRVMNLTWSEGTDASAMQALVDNYLARYKDPIARLTCKVKGITDTLRTQIITREISDILTVVCTNLGLNADCFINSITITDGPVGIPVCTWGLEFQRAEELLTIFLTGTSELDGPHVLGS